MHYSSSSQAIKLKIMFVISIHSWQRYEHAAKRHRDDLRPLTLSPLLCPLPSFAEPANQETRWSTQQLTRWRWRPAGPHAPDMRSGGHWDHMGPQVGSGSLPGAQRAHLPTASAASGIMNHAKITRIVSSNLAVCRLFVLLQMHTRHDAHSLSLLNQAAMGPLDLDKSCLRAEIF